jgi:CubicO group peptidase (beta-lactamase class C family)
MDTANVDSVLSAAVSSGNLTGVAATAWSANGCNYAGAFGEAAEGQPMQTDTILCIFSMTKAITAAAVMQLVERGEVQLDQPAGEFVPYLRKVQVLDGFADDGTPSLRPPSRPVTIRHLLTHTSGFGYDWNDESLARYEPTLPKSAPGSQASYERPLAFDPGDRWAYGIGIDWAGRLVEAVSGQRLDAYFLEHLLGPLAMHDTSFSLSAAQHERQAAMNLRSGSALTAIPFALPEDPEMLMGGGGLYSTVVDYLRFARMILGYGELDGTRVLQHATVELMSQNHIGDLSAPGWTSFNPILSNDISLLPGQRTTWGLSFMQNTQRTTEGRSVGSLAWAGLANSYYWIDHTAGVTGVFATQVLPFGDATCLAAFSAFERAVYDAIAND